MLALLLVLTPIAYELYVPADRYLCCRDFYIECFIAKLAPIVVTLKLPVNVEPQDKAFVAIEPSDDLTPH